MIRFYFRRNDVEKYCQALHASSVSLNLGLSALVLLQTRDAGASRLQAVHMQCFIAKLERTLLMSDQVETN